MTDFAVRQSIEAMEEYAVESVAADIIVNANESNYPLPQEIAEKITQRTARFPFNRYPPIKSENLCEVIAKELDVDIDCVKIGNGSSELLEKACYVFGGPGKKIAVTKTAKSKCENSTEKFIFFIGTTSSFLLSAPDNPLFPPAAGSSS